MTCHAYSGEADFHAKTCGLFADDADDAGLSPRTLADEVVDVRNASAGISRAVAVGIVAKRHRLPEYIVTSAIFGE